MMKEWKDCCFTLENTVIVYVKSARRPSDWEITNFFIRSGIEPETVVGFYRKADENAFFVKFIEDADVGECMHRLQRYNGLRINGCLVDVECSVVGDCITEVQIHNLPFEVPDHVVREKFEKYGQVDEIYWQKVEVNGFDVFNGVRIIRMHLCKVIPTFVHIHGVKARVHYRPHKHVPSTIACSSHRHHACNGKYFGCSCVSCRYP